MQFTSTRVSTEDGGLKICPNKMNITRVRNFWIETRSGIHRHVSTGPVGKSEGFETTIHIRDHKKSKPAILISGRVDGEDLILTVTPYQGNGVDKRIIIRSER